MFIEKLNSNFRRLENRITSHYNNPKQIEDPLALEVDWKPINYGGHSGIKLSNLIVKSNSLIIKPSIIVKNICKILIFLGLIIPFLIFKKNQSDLDFKFILSEQFLLTLISFIPLIVGIVFYKYISKEIVIDKIRGITWKYSKIEMYKHINIPIQKDKILAIQILKERLNRSYTYELNLVLKNLERVHLVQYSNLKRLQKDAEIIGKYLNVTIWDGVID